MAENNIARRDFIRLASVTGGIAGAHLAGVRKLGAAELQAALAAQDVWIPTCCNMCGGTTGVLAHVVGGVVKKIEPNANNPIGVANISTDFQNLKATGARMCPKGNAAFMSLYDPDRVKKPLKRAGARGSGLWEPISYDQALTEIAQKLATIKTTYGPEKLVWFTEDNNFGAIQESFCNVYGTPNFLQHSNICDAARNIGFTLALGHGRPLPDLRNTRYMLLFGVNPLAATKWALLPRILLDGLANGAKIVVVDPRCTETAEKAFDFPGMWLPIRPSTDGALALAMANVIIAERLYDANFIANWTVGFDEFAALVKNRTPEWAAGITGISADKIKQVAREVATTKPAVIDVWVGTAQHTNGTEAVRAIAMLAGLTGQIDAPGTIVLPQRPSAKYKVPAPSAPLPARVDGRWTSQFGKDGKYPFAHGSGIYVEAREAMITGQPYQPKAAVFVFQNFLLSMPNITKTRQALNNLELIVAVDTHLSELALVADYVIPGSNYLERYELLPQWVDFPVLALRQPAVAPVFGQRVEYEFVQDLALKMGYNIYPFNAPYEQFLDDALIAGIGTGLAGLKALPGAVFIGGDTHYFKYRTSGFGTPSKKFEFYSQQMKDKGLNPMPDYKPAEDGPTSTYPFYMVNWKEALHTHSRTMNNRWLMDFHGGNELWINADRASALGIKDGDLVTVQNQHASAKATARVTSRIRPDVVGMTHGFGHWGLGQVAKGKGTNDSQFVPGKADRISGMAAHKDGAVRVYK